MENVNVNLFDDLKARIIDIVTSSCEETEDFENFMEIGRDIGLLQTAMNELKEEVDTWRRKYMDLKYRSKDETSET